MVIPQRRQRTVVFRLRRSFANTICIVPTLQTASFGRVYAAYGGIFIVLSVLWGWQVDKVVPDAADIVGSIIALIGVGIMMYWPR